MGVLNSSRKAMKGFIEKSYSMGQLHGEMKKINDPRRQNLIETVHLTKAEENKIDTLFVSTYGKKIKYDWHRLYQSFTGKFDENYKLNFVPELIKTAKKLHLNAPQLGIISWDLTVDQNGVFVLIEANTRGQSIWFPQMANGMGAFGKNTAEILKFIAQK